MVVLLSGADESQQFSSIEARQRCRVGECDGPLGDSRARHDADACVEQQRHLDEAAEQVRVAHDRSGQGVAECPTGVVGLVRPALDRRFDFGKTMTIELQRVDEQRLDTARSSVRASESPEPAGRRTDPSRTSVRSAAAWTIPIEIPRPSDGLVHAHASPNGTTPVATGTPSTTYVRCRSSILAISLMSVIGSPSIQCATIGYDRTTFSQRSISIMLRRALSFELAITPTPHVPLSAGNVRIEMEPYGCSSPPNAGGIDPSAER